MPCLQGSALFAGFHQSLNSSLVFLEKKQAPGILVLINGVGSCQGSQIVFMVHLLGPFGHSQLATADPQTHHISGFLCFSSKGCNFCAVNV